MSGPSRRAFFLGLGAAVLSAPAVIRIPRLLMPVRVLAKPEVELVEFGLATLKIEGALIAYDNDFTRIHDQFYIRPPRGDWTLITRV